MPTRPTARPLDAFQPLTWDELTRLRNRTDTVWRSVDLNTHNI